MLKEIYQLVNNRLFDGTLPECEIVWLASPDGWADFGFDVDGFHAYEDGYHFIGIYVGLGTVGIFNTIIHECIHVWQADNGKKPNHGKTFKRWCEKAYEEFYE